MSITAAPLIATDVHRTYTIGGHDLPVLRGVNVEVAAGEKIFLCGQSGAGKTTLLYVLGGLEKPTRGDVLVHGKSLYHGSARERATARNRTMGFVFQHYFLLPELTALEAARPRFAPVSCLIVSASLRVLITCRLNLAAVSSSVSPSPAPSSTIPAFFTPTNRPAISMPAPVRS
jgi:ABC-type transporter Mla maintaining outer membrane lipid asymmetry ATPase subunit MlaF